MKSKKVVSLNDGLYKENCVGCGYELEWHCDFDADGSIWGAECCKHNYWMTIKTVQVNVEKCNPAECNCD